MQKYLKSILISFSRKYDACLNELIKLACVFDCCDCRHIAFHHSLHLIINVNLKYRRCIYNIRGSLIFVASHGKISNSRWRQFFFRGVSFVRVSRKVPDKAAPCVPFASSIGTKRRERVTFTVYLFILSPENPVSTKRARNAKCTRLWPRSNARACQFRNAYYP